MTNNAKKCSPKWENTLITDIQKTRQLWVSGFDLSKISPEKIPLFCNYVDTIVKNSVSGINTSIISTLMTQNFVLVESQILKIGDKQYKVSDFKSLDLKKLLAESKFIQLIDIPSLEYNLIKYLTNLDVKTYEREFIFLATTEFDKLIIKYKMESKVDVAFVGQIYATTSIPYDLVKFIFFTMSQYAEFKKDPLFRVLYNYLSNSSLDELYLFLKKY